MSGPSQLLKVAEEASLVGFDPNTNATVAASPAAWRAFVAKYPNLKKYDFLTSAAGTISNHLNELESNYLHNPYLGIVLVMLSNSPTGRTIYVCSNDEFAKANRADTRLLRQGLLDVHRTMTVRLPMQTPAALLLS
jgi:hypothetical protein